MENNDLTPDDLKRITQHARTAAVRHAQDIAEEANWRPEKERAAYAGAAASLVFQTIAVSLLVAQHRPGSPEGEAHLRSVFEGSLKDAVERWHKADLKERFGGARG